MVFADENTTNQYHLNNELRLFHLHRLIDYNALYPNFKNQNGPSVQSEKTRTSASVGFLSVLDRMRSRAEINQANHDPTAGSDTKTDHPV
jgi:hypothetical protein